MQQNLFPTVEPEFSKLHNKLIILYLLEKMDIPMTSAQIEQFVLGEGIMSVTLYSQYLEELCEAQYTDKTMDNDIARYTITGEGIQSLGLFMKELDSSVKNKVIKYVEENRRTVKQDLEIVANYFFDHKNNEYIVKCALYEDETMLMDINLSVVTKAQAVDICTNWRNNVDVLYSKIIDIIFTK